MSSFPHQPRYSDFYLTHSHADIWQRIFETRHGPYYDLEADLQNLLLEERWANILGAEDNTKWVSIPDFRAKYREVFQQRDLTEGMDLLKECARQSYPFVYVDNSELYFQMYSRASEFVNEFELVSRYVSALVRNTDKLPYIPAGIQWPHPSGPLYLECVHHNNERFYGKGLYSINRSYSHEMDIIGEHNISRIQLLGIFNNFELIL